MRRCLMTMDLFSTRRPQLISVLILLATTLHAPSVSAIARLQTVLGRDAPLVCDPSLKRSAVFKVKRMEWRKNGAIVAFYKNEGSSTGQWWVVSGRHDLDRRSYTMTIRKTEPSDTAVYECRLEFEEGGEPGARLRNKIRHAAIKQPRTIRLTVVGLPKQPRNVKVLSYTSRQVTLSWDSSDPSHADAPVVQHLIIVSVGKKPNPYNNKVAFSPGAGTKTTVSSLTPFTWYTFEVIAENLAGKGDASAPTAPIRTKGEQPVAPPKIIAIYNGTNGSLRLTWNHPPRNTRHGDLVGYRLMATRMGNGDIREYFTRANVSSYEFTDLAVHSLYEITVAAGNDFGYGPPDKTFGQTEEGVPSSGPIVTGVEERSSTSALIGWVPPRRPNGIILFYYVYVRNDDILPLSAETTDEERRKHEEKRLSKTKKSAKTKFEGSVMKYRLLNLDAYSHYSVWVTSSTSKGEGPSSDITPFNTDTAASSPPRIENVTLQTSDSVMIVWMKPAVVYRNVDNYSLKVTETNAPDDTIRPLSVAIYNRSIPISKNHKYLISVMAITNSVINPHLRYESDYSAQEAFMVQDRQTDASDVAYLERSRSIELRTSVCSDADLDHGNLQRLPSSIVCDPALRQFGYPIQPGRRTGGGGSAVWSILLFLLALVLIVTVCLLLVLFWKRRRKQQKQPKHFVDNNVATYVAAPTEPYDGANATSISCSVFPAHIEQLKADDDAGFAAEYQALDTWSPSIEKLPCELTSVYSTLPENKPKNRYINIVAYDHTRVVLRSLPGIVGSDYINANFVDGYHKPRAYITTQGPLPSTFGDFWRMVWEQKTTVIVMITNMIEKGRKKCDQYWPTEGTAESYGGSISVRLLNEYPTAFYTVRVFSLKTAKVLPRTAERLVFHYHYTHWPDHGVPFSALPVLAFVRKATEHQRDSSGPIVVHCSAGVGRSGTFIVIDAMLRQIADRKTVNSFAYLRHVRRQRNFLVQTEEQYIFCHEVLLEAIRSGRTEVAGVDLTAYIENLLPEQDRLLGKTLLRIQYELATSDTSVACNEARRDCNRGKNIDEDLVTSDTHRVVLSAEAGVDGSDYINATFMPGFHKLEEFILTQWPIATMEKTFWRMIWEYNCQTIVLLCSEDDSVGRSRFWPPSPLLCGVQSSLSRQPCSSSTADYGSFLVRTTDEAASADNRLRLVDFQLESQSDDFQLPCRLVQCANWPPGEAIIGCQGASICSSESTWDLVHTVQECYLEYQNGPVCVLDGRGGGREGALFCALNALACQLEQDNAVDVYRVAKLLNSRRPGLFRQCQDYAYMYDCLRVLVASVQSDVDQDTPFGTAEQVSQDEEDESTVPSSTVGHNGGDIPQQNGGVCRPSLAVRVSNSVPSALKAFTTSLIARTRTVPTQHCREATL